MRFITLFCVFCMCIAHIQMNTFPSIVGVGRPRTNETNAQEKPKVTELNIQEDRPIEQDQKTDTIQRDCESVFSRLWYALQGYTKVSTNEE